ncbi:MAG: M42 family metallopeptidase [Fimbriimonadaceae bacterium]|jgi:putative aminopeptidase FrvX|nr:M42 family metallopeptidase [Fimbriimonadaceae bacterium]
MARLDIDLDYLIRVLEDLLNTPSPTGDTEWAVSFVQQELESMGIASYRTQKGSLVAFFEGLQDDKPRVVTAHVDTLGAMVAQIKPNGRLRLTALNGVMWPAVESESVTIHTRSGTNIRGSIVLTNGSVHVNKEASTSPRNAETLEVRIDERTSSADETAVLGIEVGDYVSFDPRFEKSPSGFIRSRFLDDKACVACALAAVKALSDIGVSPAQRTHLLFSVFEEVGHGGMDGVPEDVKEMVVLDMACVGSGQNGDEYHCSICLKDSSGPYSRGLSDSLRAIAHQAGIMVKPDIYPYYGSDGSAYWRSGGQAQVALIGPGVDTSHGYERTHSDALRDTALLLAEYLIEA